MNMEKEVKVKEHREMIVVVSALIDEKERLCVAKSNFTHYIDFSTCSVFCHIRQMGIFTYF